MCAVASCVLPPFEIVPTYPYLTQNVSGQRIPSAGACPLIFRAWCALFSTRSMYYVKNSVEFFHILLSTSGRDDRDWQTQLVVSATTNRNQGKPVTSLATVVLPCLETMSHHTLICLCLRLKYDRSGLSKSRIAVTRNHAISPRYLP